VEERQVTLKGIEGIEPFNHYPVISATPDEETYCDDGFEVKCHHRLLSNCLLFYYLLIALHDSPQQKCTNQKLQTKINN